ncbi:MAG: S-layer homology domain-containing protein [Acidimicrobiaceae bacterium]|nr:S-layer homology domain-containing protein [Acidimicrobiaceae bacterium]
MTHRVLTVITCFALTFIVGMAVATTTFKDVADDNPHKEAIYALADTQCIRGKTADTFEPHSKVTRGQLAHILKCYVDHRTGNTTTSPSVTPGPVANSRTLTGTGKDVTEAIPLSAGAWKVTAEVAGNHNRHNNGNNFIVRAESLHYSRLVANEIVTAGAFSDVVVVGDDGISIWFSVDAAPSAEWTITVTRHA